MVNKSASVNMAQSTGQEDRSPIVTTYDWQEYVSTFCTKVKGFKKLHHLCFNSASLGFVYVNDKAGSTEVKRSVKIWSPKADELPPIFSPDGLSLQWQWCLYNKIREFGPDKLKDITM